MELEIVNQIRVPAQSGSMSDIQKVKQHFHKRNGDNVEYFAQAISTVEDFRLRIVESHRCLLHLFLRCPFLASNSGSFRHPFAAGPRLHDSDETNLKYNTVQIS